MRVPTIPRMSRRVCVAKALCERETINALVTAASSCVHVYRRTRDTSDRFPYWPRRPIREVLAPRRRDDPSQIIDVRDLAEFMVRLPSRETWRHL